MPTYEYACRSCGHELEAVQSFSDGPLTECPACGGPLRKVFSAVGIAFKGAGFYKTDSRPSSSKNTAKPGEKSAPEKAGGDAKPPPKSDGKSGGGTSGGGTSGEKGGSGSPPAPKSEPKAAASS